jgi:hypothetical protein
VNACPLMETLVVGSVAGEFVECVGASKGAWQEAPEKYPVNFSRRYAPALRRLGGTGLEEREERYEVLTLSI